MKKFLTTLAVLTVFATPAFAQSFDPDNGTRNVVAFGRAPAPAAPQNGKTAVRQNGVHSFAMVPAPSSAFNSNSPAATGGGSLGYNQNLYNY